MLNNRSSDFKKTKPKTILAALYGR